MSEQAAGSPACPQLCPRVTFSIRDGNTENVCREGSSVAAWASGLGAAGFHLGLRMAVFRKLSGWCVGGGREICLLWVAACSPGLSLRALEADGVFVR